MRRVLVFALAIMAAGAGAEAHSSQGSQRMKLCADQWKLRRAEAAAHGQSYRAFIRDCMKPHAEPAPSPDPAPGAGRH